MPLSVFVPAFNAAGFIEESVESALRQGEIVDEIVIVNDGSTDETALVSKALAGRHPQIRYAEHARNRGGGAARNTAVRLARGELLFNLDADNVLPEGLLERLVRRADEWKRDNGGHALVTPSQLQFFRDAPRRFRLGSRRTLTRVWDFDRLDREHVLTHPNSPASSGNYLFHRSIYDRVGGYYETHGAYDAWSFGVRCVLAGFTFVSAPGTAYLHRVTGVSYWQRSEESGANRETLFRALADLGCYDPSTLRALDPARADYPDDPFDCLRLAEDALGNA